MRASVDVSSLVVRCGESSWPFHLDLGQGTASIALDSCVYEVCPLTWRAKMRLARFAHLGEEFIQARFLETCLCTPRATPTGERNVAALAALAIWINLPSEETRGLPLDQGRLAGVTAELCRSLGVGPMAFAELAAAEVEMLWQNLDHETAEDEIRGIPDPTRPPQAAEPSHASEQKFNTKIVIVPDETPQTANAPQSDSQQTAVREHEAERHSSPQLTATGGSEGSVAGAAQVSGETKMAVLSQDRVIAGGVRNTTARFRVSLDKPIAKASKRTTATFRLPVSQRTSQSQSVRPEGADSVLAATAGTDHSGGSASTDTSSNLEISAMLLSPSLMQLPGQSLVQPGFAVARPAMSRWPEFEDTTGAESFPQGETMECMLDEFCERLAEAAADLGIMEEV